MRKLISIFLLVFFFTNPVKSNEDFLTLQCQSENPDLAIFKPIYIINLKTKKVKVGGDTTFELVHITPHQLVLASHTANSQRIMKIDRLTGKYNQDRKEHSSGKKNFDNGICVKKDKVF
jgi:hypothetical protein